MGINEIKDVRESLLTERLERLRRVKRGENEEQGGGGREFIQQLFEFSENEEEEGRKEKSRDVYDSGANPPEPYAPPRAITGKEVEEVLKKTTTDKPGQIIDIEI